MAPSNAKLNVKFKADKMIIKRLKNEPKYTHEHISKNLRWKVEPVQKLPSESPEQIPDG